MVALFTRAWIEIATFTKNGRTDEVALFTRAWIEISPLIKNAPLKPSPSLRGRGLKFKIVYSLIMNFGRPLYEGVD